MEQVRLNRKAIIEQFEEDRSFIYQYLTLIFPYAPDRINFVWAKTHFEHIDDMIVSLGGISYRDCFADTEFLSRVEGLIKE